MINMTGNSSKKIKALISGLISNDDQKIDSLVNELSESIIPDMEGIILEGLVESFKGETNV
jgi:hypothetical protein